MKTVLVLAALFVPGWCSFDVDVSGSGEGTVDFDAGVDAGEDGGGARASCPVDAPADQTVYLIGNSLTNNLRPALFEEVEARHITSGKSLAYALANPDDTAMPERYRWPQALASQQYDVLVLQPSYEPSVYSMLQTVAVWLDMQPNAVIVIHPGWAPHPIREWEWNLADVAATRDGVIRHNPHIMRTLMEQLELTYPDRTFCYGHSQDLLQQIAEDIEAGTAPFAAVEELYDNYAHLQHPAIIYMMHNQMRASLGQPFRADGFGDFTPDERVYMDGLLGGL